MVDQEARLTGSKQTDDSSGNSAATPSPNSCELTADDCRPKATQSDDRGRLFDAKFENHTVNLTTIFRGGTECELLPLVNEFPMTTYTKLAKIQTSWEESDELLDCESKESANEIAPACPDKSDYGNALTKNCYTIPVSGQHKITVKGMDTVKSFVQDPPHIFSQPPHFRDRSKIEHEDFSYHRCSIESLDDDYITSVSRHQRTINNRNPEFLNIEEQNIPNTVNELNLNDSVDKEEGVNKKSTPSSGISTRTGKESPKNYRVIPARSENGLEMQKLNMYEVRPEVSKNRKASLTDDSLLSARSKSKILTESELQSTYSLPVLNIRSEQY